MDILPPAPDLLPSDLIILKDLHHDFGKRSDDGRVKEMPDSSNSNEIYELTRRQLEEYKTVPSVFCTWDLQDIPFSGKGTLGDALRVYIAWAQTVVRHPTDVVFLTHLLLYFGTSVPSAIYLYYRFSWLHGVCHWILQLYYCGSFTLMLHNHIHNDGILAKRFAWFDRLWPYILEPLMGHTWDSYYYHHVKHHHVENNGPEDLSSTIRYQRDEVWDFLQYLSRFMFFIWLELPLYFIRKKRYEMASKAGVLELSSYALVYVMARRNPLATLFVLILPLVQMRIGLMIGNFGQHALVDEFDPASDFRSSITLIDVPVRDCLRRVLEHQLIGLLEQPILLQ